MTPIQAFVGHSFTEDDEIVVSKFLKYLNQVSELHPNFSWVHAESAEPRVIDAKVLSLFDSKNLFIAICTKKERVIAPPALKNHLSNGYPPRKKTLDGRRQTGSFKKSAWQSGVG